MNADRSVTVARHQLSSLSDSEASAILDQLNDVLGEKDGPGDEECGLKLSLEGSVMTLPGPDLDGDGVIEDETEYDHIMGMPGQIKFVNGVGWCDGPGINIIGCAPIPGGSALVTRRPSLLQDGVLWAHEYGHNMGLQHRGSNDNEVMHPQIADSHLWVNEDEKAYYLRGGAAMEPGPPQPATSVDNFVKKVYVEGIPHGAASQYTAADVPRLLALLPTVDPQYRANVVTVLGIIGDPTAAAPLRQYFESGTGQLSRDEYFGKLAVLLYLGEFIRKSNHAGSLTYLRTGVIDPQNWSQRVQWASPFTNDSRIRNWSLTKMAIWGLAATGKDDGLNAINALEVKLAKPNEDIDATMRPVPPDVYFVVNEAQLKFYKVRHLNVKFFARKHIH